MGAFVGRDVVVNFAIAEEDATPGGLTFKRLGMMRGKSMKTDWDTVDTTADQSAAFTKTNLVTFKMVEFSGDGVSFDDAAYNQDEFRLQAVSPGASTSYQPKVWLQMIDPASGLTYEGPFIVTTWEDARPHANEATWKMAAKSNGDVTLS